MEVKEPMNRNALLLYLRNVRDLEIAKAKIVALWDHNNRDLDSKMEECQTIPQLKSVTPLVYEEPSGVFWFFAINAVLDCLSMFVIPIVANGEMGGMGAFFVFIFMFGAILFGTLAYKCYPPSKKKQLEEWREKRNKIDKYNARQRLLARKNKERLSSLKTYKATTDSHYESEYKKVCNLLAQFYSMNILASQYRNCASVVYIYDYMATSQASLEDTLIHEHMEDGIQRLEVKLDQVLDRLDDVVYETRCLRSDNKAGIQRTIEQNNQMLKQLQEVSRNSQEAAQYAELASNYSKANAYFSLANYFK